MQYLKIIDTDRQTHSLIANGKRVTIHIHYNTVDEQWFFDLALDGEYILHGRRIVPNIDLIRSFDFDVGQLFAFSKTGEYDGRWPLINGTFNLYQRDV